MAKIAARTGIVPTLVVAIEQSFPQEQRIIDDDLAGRMLPVAARVLVRLVQPRLIRNRLVGILTANACTRASCG